ncbi:MAG: sugar phosphate isomerase/epimerase family protein [Chitinivibrionales bacterium]
MSDWAVGISTGCFYHSTIFSSLESIRRGGFCMLEVCSSPRHLDYHDQGAVKKAARLIDELGMEAYSFHAPFAENIDITSMHDKQREYSKHELIKAADAAATLHARYFVTHPGPEKSIEAAPAERMHRMYNAAEVLDAVSEHCHRLGIGLILENMLPHLFFGNTRDMLWIMGAINHVNVGTCLDTGHATLSGDIYRVMYKLSGHLKLIHANDNNRHGDDHLPPGKGCIDWKRLLTELNQTGFQGGLILELSGDTNETPEQILNHARSARQLIRKLSRQIALSSPPTVSAGNQPPLD